MCIQDIVQFIQDRRATREGEWLGLTLGAGLTSVTGCCCSSLPRQRSLLNEGDLKARYKFVTINQH